MKPGPDKAATDREVLLYFVQGPDPGYTVGELADNFDRTRQWADNRLGDLESKKMVKSKNPGGGSKFYWITKKGETYLSNTANQEPSK